MIDTSQATTQKEKVKIITDKLEKGIKELMSSEKYMEYLSKMSKLHNYSFRNTVLILMQHPDATMVASLTTWNKEFHRSVNKGEKGITILAPCKYKKYVDKFVYDDSGDIRKDNDGVPITKRELVESLTFKPTYVFDAGQTHGEPIPQIAVSELTGNVENYDKIVEAIKSVSPVDISFENYNSSAKGFYSNAEKRIVIKEGMEELQTLKTLIHEVAHSILHDNEIMKSTGEQKDTQTKEVEAESIAYTVSSYLGLDTSDYSFGYVSGWAGERKIDAVKESMETIRKTADELITAIERQLHPELTVDRTESQQHTQSRAMAV
jgi:hypothetical protein